MKSKNLIIVVVLLAAGAVLAVPRTHLNSIIPHFGTIPTCSSSIEGAIETDILSGGAATGKRTKSCLCTSNGSGAYAWQNLATATVGTTTTCGTE